MPNRQSIILSKGFKNSFFAINAPESLIECSDAGVSIQLKSYTYCKDCFKLIKKLHGIADFIDFLPLY